MTCKQQRQREWPLGEELSPGETGSPATSFRLEARGCCLRATCSRKRRSCTYLHGERPRAYRGDRTPTEVACVLALLERCTHEHEPQVGPLSQQPSDHDQQELAVAIPFVDLRGQRPTVGGHAAAV